MANAPKKEKPEPIPHMPFDEAMKRILRAPHSPKTTKKPAKKKIGR
jgi:hypothetical protein